MSNAENRFGIEWVIQNRPGKKKKQIPNVEIHRRLNNWDVAFKACGDDALAIKECLGEDWTTTHGTAYIWWQHGLLPEDITPKKWGTAKRRTKAQRLEALDEAHKSVHRPSNVHEPLVPHPELTAGAERLLSETEKPVIAPPDDSPEGILIRLADVEEDLTKALARCDGLETLCGDLAKGMNEVLDAISGHGHSPTVSTAFVHEHVSEDFHTHRNFNPFRGIWRRLAAGFRGLTSGN
jgi:hypothetical protein